MVCTFGLYGVTERARVDSRWIRTTLRFSVHGVCTRLVGRAGCSATTPVYESTSLAITPLIPVTIKLTNGSLANDLLAPAGVGPARSEGEPKLKAWRQSPRGPKRETF